MAKPLAADDHSAEGIKEEEEYYFRYLDSRSEDVARELSRRAELDEEFVADEKLWRWIEDREGNINCS